MHGRGLQPKEWWHPPPNVYNHFLSLLFFKSLPDECLNVISVYWTYFVKNIIENWTQLFRDGIGVAWFDGEKDVTWGRGSKSGGFGRDVLSEKNLWNNPFVIKLVMIVWEPKYHQIKWNQFTWRHQNGSRKSHSVMMTSSTVRFQLRDRAIFMAIRDR